MKIVLKTFDNNSLEDVLTLFLKVFEKEPWNDKWKSRDHAKAYLTDLINTPGFNGYLALKDDTIIGCCLGYIVKWWQGDEYYIKEFFIDDAYQLRGIGSELYDYAVSNLKTKNVQSIILLTEKTAPAFSFYLKKGLTVSPETVFMGQNIK